MALLQKAIASREVGSRHPREGLGLSSGIRTFATFATVPCTWKVSGRVRLPASTPRLSREFRELARGPSSRAGLCLDLWAYLSFDLKSVFLVTVQGSSGSTARSSNAGMGWRDEPSGEGGRSEQKVLGSQHAEAIAHGGPISGCGLNLLGSS